MMFFNAKSFTQKLCTPSWVTSNATKGFMFDRSPGSISPIVCTPSDASTIKVETTIAAPQHETHRTIPDRELKAYMLLNTAAISSTIQSQSICPKCGTFTKSGRASCCAPGGAWYDECGGAGNEHVEHTWLEGAKACRRKFEATCMQTCVAQ